MLESQKKYLLGKIKKYLREGKRIVVFGWIDGNHSPETRRYGETKRVCFKHRKTDVSKNSHDLVIFTKYVAHTDVQRINKSSSSVYQHPVGVREIRELLKSCETEIYRKAHTQQSDTDFSDDLQTVVVETTPDLNDLEKLLLSTEVILSEYEKLAARFAEAISTDPNQSISSHALTALLKELGFKEKTPVLAREGWFLPMKTGEMKKISRYTAGEKLKELLSVGKKEEPQDPMDKLTFLIAQKPEYQAKIDQIREQLTYWEGELARSNLAEEIYQQIQEQEKENKRRISEL